MTPEELYRRQRAVNYEALTDAFDHWPPSETRTEVIRAIVAREAKLDDFEGHTVTLRARRLFVG
jgi:hypothetical protein